jgi:hypothetical protein
MLSIPNLYRLHLFAQVTLWRPPKV